MEKTRNDDVIDLGQILLALRKRLGLIILAGLVVAFGAALYTRFLMTPVYTSSSTMLVLTKETTLASVADLQLGTQLTKDYSVLIESRPVLEETIDNLGLDMSYQALRNSVEITNPAMKVKKSMEQKKIRKNDIVPRMRLRLIIFLSPSLAMSAPNIRRPLIIPRE